MTIDLIRQAIERLEKLRAESTQGEWDWFIDGSSRRNPYGIESSLGSSEIVASELKDADARLILSLHRTIDAQLEILECGLDLHVDIVVVEHAELLAEAIMGAK